MERIETTITFPYGLPCKKEVLGMEYDVIIGTHKGIIAFPNIPKDFKERIKNDTKTNNNLITPINTDKRLLINSETDWGYFSDTLGNSIVNRCSIWFYCNSNEIEMVGNEVRTLTMNYIDKIILFVEILSKKVIDENSNDRIKFEYAINYWFWDKNEGMLPANENVIKFNLWNK